MLDDLLLDGQLLVFDFADLLLPDLRFDLIVVLEEVLCELFYLKVWSGLIKNPQPFLDIVRVFFVESGLRRLGAARPLVSPKSPPETVFNISHDQG